MVFRKPRFGRPRRAPRPKTLARLAPIRSWIRALPLRSNQSSTAARLSTITTITIALMAPISSSTHTMLELVDQFQDGACVQVFVVAIVIQLQHRRGAAPRHA